MYAAFTKILGVQPLVTPMLLIVLFYSTVPTFKYLSVLVADSYNEITLRRSGCIILLFPEFTADMKRRYTVLVKTFL